MVIFYVSDRHGAVCLSVSCDVLWCLTLSLSPVALGTNPRLSMSFLFWFFFFLFCIHPCCTLLCSPLPPCVLHAGPCGDTCAILLPPARSAQCLASKVTETLENLPEGSSSAISKGCSEHRARSCPLCVPDGALCSCLCSVAPGKALAPRELGKGSGVP